MTGRSGSGDAEALRYLDLVFRQIPGLIWTTDRELAIIHVFGRLYEQARIDQLRIEGRTLSDVLHSGGADVAIAHHRAALEGRSASFGYAFRGRRYQALVEPLVDPDDRISGCVGAAIDVTELVRTDEELEQSRRLLADAQALAHVGSWEWEIERNVVTWSDEVYLIYGLPKGDFSATYESFLQRVHPDDLGHTQAVLFAAVRDPKPFNYDHRIVRPDGSVRMLQTRGDVTLDDAGKATRMMGCCWDVTDKWEADQGRERAISLLEATLDATADGLLVVDLAGKVTAHNVRFRTLWGISEAMAMTRTDEELLDYVADQLEDPRTFLSQVRELYAAPDRESFDVLRFKDGRVFERYSTPQRLGSEIVGRVWSFRDVTDRERLYRQAVFLADAARLLASLDVEKALEAVARLAVPFLGEACAVDLLEVGGFRRLLTISSPPGSSLATDLPAAVYAGHATTYAIASTSYMSVPMVARGRVLGVITLAALGGRSYLPRDLDLVEEVARRATLSVENARVYAKAQEALRARDEFLAIAAHEIRGPITSIHLAVQSLATARTPAAAHPTLRAIIEREDRRLARFVDELLDLGRIQSGRLQFDLQHVELSAIVRDVATRLAPDLARSGTRLSVTTAGPVVGRWDAMRIDQIVANLLSNAIKFGQGRPIDLVLEIEDSHVRLVVRDQGIGIPEEMQHKIFEPFERGVSTRNYGGLGLGLYIVRTAVEGMGGSVRVQSEPGHGSTFTVELPLE